MKKRGLIITTALALLLAAAVSAYAATYGNRGVVKRITKNQIVFQTSYYHSPGETQYKMDSVGGMKVVNIDRNTRFRERYESKPGYFKYREAGFSDLKVGDFIIVSRTSFGGSSNTARLIIIHKRGAGN